MLRLIAYACMAMAGWAAVTQATAATARFTLAPGPVQLGFRAYGMGFVPIDGGFTRFRGTLILDDSDGQACVLDVRAEAASLRMPQQDMTDDALGEDLLDVAHFPDFQAAGQCSEGKLQGTLLLHGVTRPVVLDVSVGKGRWTASGLIRRGDWGMGARPLMAGPEVRISIVATLPAGFPSAR